MRRGEMETLKDAADSLAAADAEDEAAIERSDNLGILAEQAIGGDRNAEAILEAWIAEGEVDPTLD